MDLVGDQDLVDIHWQAGRHGVSVVWHTMCVCWRSCPMELLAPGRYSRSVPLPALDLDRDLGAVSVLATLPRPPKVLVWARRLARSGALGPKGQDAWTAEYVQQGVRGRGHNREPHDLLITDGVAIARLRHGTLRGRTTRNGYKLQGTAIHSASHRYLRNQLDAYNLEVHLCACDPCGLDDDDCLHVGASSIIPRTTELDLQETAGRGPFGRCAVATWFWGCRCAPFTAVWRFGKSIHRCMCRGGCGDRRERARRGAHGEAPPTPKHDDSETETEGEDELTCQADRVSYVSNGQTIPLSEQPCRDLVSGDLVRLMDADATRSNQEELIQEDAAYFFAGCNHHRAVYENSVHKRRCAVDGCYAEAKLNKDGLRLCKLHSAKEERPKAAVRRVKAKIAPKAKSTPEAPPSDGDEVLGPRPETRQDGRRPAKGKDRRCLGRT